MNLKLHHKLEIKKKYNDIFTMSIKSEVTKKKLKSSLKNWVRFMEMFITIVITLFVVFTSPSKKKFSNRSKFYLYILINLNLAAYT